MAITSISGAAWKAVQANADNPLDIHARFLNDGTVDIDLHADTLTRLAKHRQPGETISDTILRICAHGNVRQIFWQKPKGAVPTVIDAFYKSSFSKEAGGGWTSNAKWREAFTNARRFVLDDDMSTFLGELCTQAFAKEHVSRPTLYRMVEHLRLGARLPYETTWVEYNLRNSMKRSHELFGTPFNPTESPAREGWLLQQHPQIPNAIRVHILSHDDGRTDTMGFSAWTFPVTFAWTVDEDTVLPWRPVPFDIDKGQRPSEVATGVKGYITDRASICFSDMVNTPNNAAAVANLIAEWAGVLRRVWAFLATINDLPVQLTDVRPSKGFLARGNYRKFLHHKTVTLTVPQKKYRKVIREALALAHRRAHGVRGHWRKDWRNPLSALCEHDFTADEKHMVCTHCKGRKSWVTPHQRGDVLQGLTLHDYKVTHEPTHDSPSSAATSSGHSQTDSEPC